MIRIVGFFCELEPEARARLPSASGVAGQLDESLVEPVLKHLRGGETFLDVMGYQLDPIDRRTYMRGGMSLVTDGEWIWRADLSYLVERHRVGLPVAFLDHVATAAGELQTSERERIVERWRDFEKAYRTALYEV